MSRFIRIENFRHIKKLTFHIPPPGVHLLTGANGSGKSTILGCLLRIGDSSAFQKQFPSAKNNAKLDNAAGSSITFHYDAHREVTYKFSDQRWAPHPRAQSKLLPTTKLGFTSVLHIGATADRITPSPHDFEPKNIKDVEPEVVSAANTILATSKFTGLKKINLTTGNKNPAYLMTATKSPQISTGQKNKQKHQNKNYITERHFSLGELCVLKLVLKLKNCPNRSLVLIDELELALHPQAQIQMLNHITKMAKSKELTVLFSTHSVSLINQVDRKNIIHLEHNSATGEIDVVNGCFPTYVIGAISYEFVSRDILFFVEDEAAASIVRHLLKLVRDKKFQKRANAPSFAVIPIGGWDNVIRFIDRSAPLLPKNSTRYALLDYDAKEALAKTDQTLDIACIAERNKKLVSYLPWTPEVGLIQFIQKHKAKFNEKIKCEFDIHRNIVQEDAFDDIDTTVNSEEKTTRKKCKEALKSLVIELQRLNGKEEKEINEFIFQIYGSLLFEHEQNELMSFLGPFLSS